MSETASGLTEMASRLLALEAGEPASATDLADAAQAVCRHLDEGLSTFVGSLGTQALLGRAVATAANELPWLREVKVEGGTCELSGLSDAVRGRDRAVAARGVAAIIANALRILAGFVGEDLTVRLVEDAWPELAPKGRRTRAKGAHRE
jgi:hypothetical protein